MMHRNHQALLSAGRHDFHRVAQVTQSPDDPETASSRRDPPLIIHTTPLLFPSCNMASRTTLSEQQTFDVALNQIRVGLVSVPGIAIPFPFGGKQRLVSVDLDARKLQEKNLTQTDVTSAINAQALVFPAARPSLARSNTRST